MIPALDNSTLTNYVTEAAEVPATQMVVRLAVWSIVRYRAVGCERGLAAPKLRASIVQHFI